MKVIQGAVTKFEPVTIVLQKEEEADLMWYLFNKGPALGLEDHLKTKAHMIGDWQSLRWDMSDSYRRVYRPKGEDC